MMSRHARGGGLAALAVMLATPLFFSSNLIFGRGVIGEVAPFTLAFLRWAAVALCLSPLAWRERAAVASVAAAHPGLLLLLGFLGMWVCGALVYLALEKTSATNGTLIYTTSPVMILLIEALWLRRAIGLRAAVGSAIALAGVAAIVLKGRPLALFDLDFNRGDLLFVAAAVSWAVYSLLLRTPVMAQLTNAALLAVVAAAGATTLAPFAAWEVVTGATMPATAAAWQAIAGIVIVSSLLAFLGFQFSVRRLGATRAGVFMYLMPVYGVGLAVFLLGESFHLYHLAGMALVSGGVVLATLPASLMRRSPR